MKIFRPLALLVLLTFFWACKKGGDNNGPYNGFKLNGVLYSKDTIERDFWATGYALRIRSKDNGGGLIYIRRGGNEWPVADVVYNFTVLASREDSTTVNFCFESDDQQSDYCSMTGPGASTTLTITITNGHWNIHLPPTLVMDSDTKSLEIEAHD